MDSSSLELFQDRLDGALSNLIEEEIPLPVQSVWTRWSLNVPSNPKCSMIESSEFAGNLYS